MAGIMDPVWGKLSNRALEFMAQPFSVNGDGTGIHDIILDYSSTPTDFYVQPAAGYIYRVYQVDFYLSVDTAIERAKYGAITGLTNGLKFIVSKNGTEATIENFKDNVDLFRATTRYSQVDFKGGSALSIVQFEFIIDPGQQGLIRLTENDKMIVRANDSFVGLSENNMYAHGALFKIGV